MLWVKAFHIIAIICWFAGLFYLPRLFVYHAMSDDQISKDRFVIMETKLFWAITTPSAIIAIVLGMWLLLNNPGFFLSFWWMHAKLALVLLLAVYHLACWRFMIAFKLDLNTHSHRFYRLFNELPVPLLVAIVVLIVVRPAFS